jgi:hypothetical protein
MRVLIDHLEWARAYRRRAARCSIAADSTSSSEFRQCYRELAHHYEGLARLEEDFFNRQKSASLRRVGEMIVQAA